MRVGRYTVAVVGIVCATVLGVADLVFKGPDSAILAAVVGAITGIVAYVFGRSRRVE